MFGDIKSFYDEIFIKVENLEKNFEFYLKTNPLIEIPNRFKLNENNKSKNNISISIGNNLFIDYSTNKIQSNISFQTNKRQIFSEENSKQNLTSNVLSSSIQAGLILLLNFYWTSIFFIEFF